MEVTVAMEVKAVNSEFSHILDVAGFCLSSVPCPALLGSAP